MLRARSRPASRRFLAKPAHSGSHFFIEFVPADRNHPRHRDRRQCPRRLQKSFLRTGIASEETPVPPASRPRMETQTPRRPILRPHRRRRNLRCGKEFVAELVLRLESETLKLPTFLAHNRMRCHPEPSEGRRRISAFATTTVAATCCRFYCESVFSRRSAARTYFVAAVSSRRKRAALLYKMSRFSSGVKYSAF